MMKEKVKKLMALLMIPVIGITTTQLDVWAAENTWIEYEQTEVGEGTATESVYESEGYKVTFTLSDNWEGGYNANIEIANTGDFPIHNWYISYYSDNTISNIWNAEIESYEEGMYIIKNVGWNQDIAPGESVSFGMSGNENFEGFPEEYEILGASMQISEEDYSIEYQLDSDWESGFGGTIQITNHTDVTIEDWSLAFDFERTITDIWNGSVEVCDGNHYVIGNAGHNGNIAPGQTISIGFNGQEGTAEDIPYAYQLFSYKMYDLDESTKVDENADTDNDGVADYLEDYFGTDKTKEDTDEDGLSDYLELLVIATNPLLADTDGNGINDGDEDADQDGCFNLSEVEMGTDLAKADTDSDGLTDYEEYVVYDTEPLNDDSDEDGASDGREIELGTDPLVADEVFYIVTQADIEESEDTVKASVEAVLSGEQVDTLSVEKYEDDLLFPETMPGYVGSAYEFRVEGDMDTATICFEFDADLQEDDAFVPAIYGLYEEVPVLEELDTTITENVATAEIADCSKYILLNKKEFQDSLSENQDMNADADMETDSDEDGITDYVEDNMVLFNGVPMMLDKNSPDSDGDGLYDSEEVATISTFAIGSQSNAAGTTLLLSNPLEEDSDFDGRADSVDAAPINNTFTGTLTTDYATSDVKFKMDYRWFFKDNTIYNADLSKTSILFSSAIYDENTLSIQDSLKKNTTSGTSMESIMKYFGMSAAKTVSLDETYNDIHLSEVGLGYRTVSYNGQTKNVVAVIVRGTNKTIEEWSSNFEIGKSSTFASTSDWKTKNNHAGFDIAANRIMKEVDQYVSANGLKNTDIAYWVTGHSRGAAIANIIGAYYEAADKTAYTYTFAAPNTTMASKATSYETIFNIINTDDFVPYLPMTDWGYSRYGNTTSVSVAEDYEKEWQNLTDIVDYNPDTYGMQNTVAAMADIIKSDARIECYKYTCKDHGDGSNDTITVTNYGTSKKSREAAIDKIPDNALPYGIITRYNGFLMAGWDFDVCQSPAYFMQILAAIMAEEINAYRFTVELNIADRYEEAKSAIIKSYLGGIKHPHYTESYYVLANNVKASDF